MKIILLMLLSTNFVSAQELSKEIERRLKSLTQEIETLKRSLQKGGQETGNGGGGFLCEKEGNKATVHLLDFWEAESLKGLVIKRNKNHYSDQVEEALAEMRLRGNSGLASSIESEFKRINRNFKNKKAYLPADVAIAAPKDARNVYKKRDCQLKGFATYNDVYNIVEFDLYLSQMLSPTQFAGLLFHESVYKYLRDRFLVKDSIVARNITGCAFSKKPCDELNPTFGVPKKRYTCTPRTIDAGKRHDPSSFYFYQVKQNCSINNRKYDGWRLAITSIGGYPVPTLTYVDFCPGIDPVPYIGTGSIPKFAGHQEVSYTKSSADRWKDIGLKKRVHTSFDKTGFKVNGTRFFCH